MRLIYLDESSTPAAEPFTLVVGIVVDPDVQLLPATMLLREAIDAAPVRRDEPFVFHATDIFQNTEKYNWTPADRIALIKRVLRIPMRTNIPIALGMVRRTADSREDHAMAFGGCLALADRYMRDYLDPSQIGIAIAEDVPDMRSDLRKIVFNYTGTKILLPKDHLDLTVTEKDLGYSTQNTDMRIIRIRSSVLFVDKDIEPMTQIADAIAFAFRRFFASETMGDDMMAAMLPYPIDRRDYAGQSSYMCFRFHP
jgi:hypothetical protein